MFRKKVFFLLLFLSQIGYLTAQNSRFKDGETLYIWATSGMNLREKPDPKATKLATIPYGAKVVTQPNVGAKIPFEVEEFRGFTVKGNWIRVKHGNTEGYIFDGFLSKLPAPVSQKELAEFEMYLDKHIGKIGDKFEAKVWDKIADTARVLLPNEKFDVNTVQSYKQKYKQGILFAYSLGEGGSSTTVELPNFTLYEAYLIVKVYYYNPKFDVFSVDKKDKSVNMDVKDGGGGCAFNIKQVGNKIIIDGGCGC